MSPTLVIIVVVLGWFAPVGVVLWIAKEARKDTRKVLVAGLLLGWIGAGLAAAILPPLTDQEAARRPTRADAAPLEPAAWRIIWIGIALAFGLAIAVLTWLAFGV